MSELEGMKVCKRCKKVKFEEEMRQNGAVCKKCSLKGTSKSRFAYHLRKSYNGLTLEAYEEMFEKQEGVCASCKKPDINGRRLCVDYTVKLVGLLCGRCNIVVASARKNKDVMDYLAPLWIM